MPSRLVYEQGRPRFPNLEIEVALELLAAIDSASDLAQLEALHWAGLRPLSRSAAASGSPTDLAGRWAVAAGEGAWICFRFDRGHAYEVDVVERLGIRPW